MAAMALQSCDKDKHPAAEPEPEPDPAPITLNEKIEYARVGDWPIGNGEYSDMCIGTMVSPGADFSIVDWGALNNGHIIKKHRRGSHHRISENRR